MINIIKNGLWYNNPAILQLLGLCPLLAVSNNLVNALTLGIATTIVMLLSSSVISLLRNYIDNSLRIPYFMLIIASIVTLVILYIKAFSYNLYNTLGVYLALITTNCVILGRIEAFAYKNNFTKSIIDSLANGLGFSIVLVLLGAIREIIGNGTLCYNCQQLLGSHANNWVINFDFILSDKIIIAIMAPGAFLSMGFIIALKNYLSSFKNKTKIYEQTKKISDIPTLTTKKS